MKNTIIFFAFVLFTSLTQGQNILTPKYDCSQNNLRCFTLTQDSTDKLGGLWWNWMIDFSKDTTFRFVLYFGDKNVGGEGLAFVLHQDERDTSNNKDVTVGDYTLQGAIGEPGEGLGYGSYKDDESLRISPSVAIEFDTHDDLRYEEGYGDEILGEPSPYAGWDHISVVYNGDMKSQQKIIFNGDSSENGRILPIKPIQAFGPQINGDGTPFHNVEDGNSYAFEFKWIVNDNHTQTLEVWVATYRGHFWNIPFKRIMVHTDDMLGKVFKNYPMVWLGFTGSTGKQQNEQSVCLLGENLKPFAEDIHTEMNVFHEVLIETELSDPDGDDLYVNMANKPLKGEVELISSPGYPRNPKFKYKANKGYTGYDSFTYSVCDAIYGKNSIIKCDTGRVTVKIIPKANCDPFNVTTKILKQAKMCVPELGEDEGEAIASTNHPNEKQVNYVWYPAEDLTNPIYVGKNPKNLYSQDYSVVAYDTVNGCSSDTSSIYIDYKDLDGVSIDEVQPLTRCDKPTGILRAGVIREGKDITDNYTYLWFLQETGVSDTMAYGPELKYVWDNQYHLQVKDKKTGCMSLFSKTVFNNTISPRITTTLDKSQVTCNSSSRGNLSASVNGTTDGYEFSWHFGYTYTQSPDFIGSTVEAPLDGKYTVFAKDLKTKCGSDYKDVLVENTADDCTNKALIQIKGYSITRSDINIDIFLEGFSPTNIDTSNIIIYWPVKHLKFINSDYVNQIELRSIDESKGEISFGLIPGTKNFKASLHFEGIGEPGTYNFTLDDKSFIKDTLSNNYLLIPNLMQFEVPEPRAAGRTVKMETTEGYLLSGSRQDTIYGPKFRFQLPYNQECTITPMRKHVGKSHNTVIDDYLLRMYLDKNFATNDPYSVIACDVDNDHLITEADVNAVENMILGKNSTFDPNTFILKNGFDSQAPLSYKTSIPLNLTADSSEIQFTTLYRGDINNDTEYIDRYGYNYASNFPLLYHVTFDNNQWFANIFAPREIYAILGMQFTLNWDPAKYTFSEISEASNGWHFNTESTEEGWVTALWLNDNVNNLDSSGQYIHLFELSFEHLDGDNLHDLLLSSEITPAIAYTNADEVVSLTLEQSTNLLLGTDLKSINSDIKLYPNPATIELTLSNVPIGCNYLITDLNGKLIAQDIIPETRKINISKLKPGLYILIMEVSNEHKAYQRFVKE